ncbi:hypothetical protein SAMN05443633_10435 [Chryseobacterium arachidis]|uniref:Uncharacterized protein n=2 Tax=Chryseobacterium arachidis TaxID=1416778 RepID=A0A1M5B4N3_9FLAO|nr:hypothetical protein SAMN05443633_10435 [Chryseobacterium arachidis]
MSNAEEKLISNTINVVNNSLEDGFCYPFCKLLEQLYGLKKPFTTLDFYKKNCNSNNDFFLNFSAIKKVY